MVLRDRKNAHNVLFLSSGMGYPFGEWMCFLRAKPTREHSQYQKSWRDSIFKLNRNIIEDLDEHFGVSFGLKAIWARRLNIPYAEPFDQAVRDVNDENHRQIPRLEHWAFLACATLETRRRTTFQAYFVAHFNPGQQITTEPDRYSNSLVPSVTFSKVLAASEVRGQTSYDVNIKRPEIADEDGLVLRANTLVHKNHDPDRWAQIQTPLSLEELTNKIYETECLGVYHELENHCQDFANSLYHVVSGNYENQRRVELVRSWSEIAKTRILCRVISRNQKVLTDLLLKCVMFLSIQIVSSF